MQQIPITAIAAQTFNVVLDDQYCTISLYWRQEWLYLTLTTGAEIICQGAICQNKTDIVQSPSLHFTGSLHFFDTEGDRPPYWEELNTRFKLIYIAQGETVPDKLRY